MEQTTELIEVYRKYTQLLEAEVSRLRDTDPATTATTSTAAAEPAPATTARETTAPEHATEVRQPVSRPKAVSSSQRLRLDGKKIKKQRETLDMTQTDLAAKLGISKQSIAAWEMCRWQPGKGTHEQLTQALQCSLEELMKSD